eukprot:CCRYP_012384-RA/>CCRYP_012384-RA protein AED:0.12 eAED:0.12 QI:112/1/1/1/0.8/0.66/6/4153/508
MRLSTFFVITSSVSASQNPNSDTFSSKASKSPTGYNAIKREKKEEKRKKKAEDAVANLKDPFLGLAHEIEQLTKDADEVKDTYFPKSSDNKSDDSLVESDSSEVPDQRNGTSELAGKSDAKDCTKDMCQYELSPDYLLEYKVNVPEDTTLDECAGCSLRIKVTYDGTAWLGFAFSKNGEMIGSEAVIGHPLMADTVPGKYYLGGKYDGAIQPMEDERQTLINATINFENGQSVLEFEKQLKEEGEIEILPGLNTFLWAHGNDNEFSTYHGNNRNSFQLNILGERDPGGPDAEVNVIFGENPDLPNTFVNAVDVIQSNSTSSIPPLTPVETPPFDEVPPCPPAYNPSHTRYTAGDKVEVNNYIWECRAYPYDMYCNIPDFKPSMKKENSNAEDLWLNAWSAAGECYKTQSPTMRPSIKASSLPTELILTALPTQSPIGVIVDTDTGFPFVIPQLRYTEWNELEQNERDTAESIGYNRYAWNNLEVSEIEKTAFRVLSTFGTARCHVIWI